MLLKKQTVWLLTMLSLVVVLSVYYITSPEQNRRIWRQWGTEGKARKREKHRQMRRMPRKIQLQT